MKILIAAALLTSISLAPALAADTAKPAAAASNETASAKPAADQKVICTKEAQVGSIIPKKVCRTAEQLEADRRAAQQIDQDRQRQGLRGDSALLR